MSNDLGALSFPSQYPPSRFIAKIPYTISILLFCIRLLYIRGRRGRMIVGFTTTCAISVYHHYICEFEPRLWRGELDTILCDMVCQWLATGPWFTLGSPVSSTNKTDCHDMAEMLLKVALNTITITPFLMTVILLYGFDNNYLLVVCLS
jgi:hypothetical protein